MSVVASVLSKLGTLSLGMNAYFDGPPVWSSTSQITVPFVTFYDEGITDPDYDTEYNAIQTTRIRIEVWAEGLAAVDAAVAKIKYGGGTPAQRLGFDFGTLTITTPSGYAETTMEMRRISERRRKDQYVSQDVKPVHVGELVYLIQTSVTGA